MARRDQKSTKKLTAKEMRAILKRGQEEGIKQFANKGKKNGFLRNDILEEYKIPLASFKDKKDYFIDILQKPVGERHPTLSAGKSIFVFEVKCHQIQVGGKKEMLCCPEATFPNLGIKCPYCEKFREELDNGVDWNDVSEELKLKNREIYYISYADGPEVGKGVYLLEISNFYMGTPIAKLITPKVRLGQKNKTQGFVNIADIDEGKTLSFTVEEKSMTFGAKVVKVNALTSHSLEERINEIDDETVERLFELPPLEDLVEVLSYDELYEKLNGEKSGDEESDNGEDEKPGDIETREEVEEMDEDDLLDFADDNDIELSKKDKRTEKKLKKAILSWYDDKFSEESEEDEEGWPKDFDDVDELEEFLEDKSKKEKKVFVKSLDVDVKGMDEDDLDDEIKEHYGLED